MQEAREGRFLILTLRHCIGIIRERSQMSRRKHNHHFFCVWKEGKRQQCDWQCEGKGDLCAFINYVSYKSSFVASDSKLVPRGYS